MSSTPEEKNNCINNIKSIIKKEPIGVSSFILSLLSFIFTIILNSTIFETAEISDLISKEASYAISSNIDGVVSLYTEDAIIRDWGDWASSHPINYWYGEKEIRERYTTYKSNNDYTNINHINIKVTDVNWFSGTANAKSSTVLRLVEKSTNKKFNLSTSNGDTWDFKKTGRIFFLPWTGHWKISSFTYNDKGSNN